MNQAKYASSSISQNFISIGAASLILLTASEPLLAMESIQADFMVSEQAESPAVETATLIEAPSLLATKSISPEFEFSVRSRQFEFPPEPSYPPPSYQEPQITSSFQEPSPVFVDESSPLFDVAEFLPGLALTALGVGAGVLISNLSNLGLGSAKEEAPPSNALSPPPKRPLLPPRSTPSPKSPLSSPVLPSRSTPPPPPALPSPRLFSRPSAKNPAPEEVEVVEDSGSLVPLTAIAGLLSIGLLVALYVTGSFEIEEEPRSPKREVSELSFKSSFPPVSVVPKPAPKPAIKSSTPPPTAPVTKPAPEVEKPVTLKKESEVSETTKSSTPPPTAPVTKPAPEVDKPVALKKESEVSETTKSSTPPPPPVTKPVAAEVEKPVALKKEAEVSETTKNSTPPPTAPVTKPAPEVEKPVALNKEAEVSKITKSSTPPPPPVTKPVAAAIKAAASDAVVALAKVVKPSSLTVSLTTLALGASVLFLGALVVGASKSVPKKIPDSAPAKPTPPEPKLKETEAAERRTSVASAVEVKSIGDKELAAKIASLEKQIKDANSEARRGPLVAQLIALRPGSSYSAPTSARPSSTPTSARSSAPVPTQARTPAASFSTSVVGDKELTAKIASLEQQIKDANSDARKAPLVALLNALRSGSSYSAPTSARPSSTPTSARSSSVLTKSVATSLSASAVSDKELVAKIVSLQKQIKDANSDARKAPLVAMLNALMSESSFSAPTSARSSSAPISAQAETSASSGTPVVGDKDLAAKIAYLEKQIKDANSEARRGPLVAQLIALRSGSSYSAPTSARPAAAAFSSQSKTPAASFSTSVVGDKDLAAKIASLEKQIKDANSDARKAPLVAQLHALRSDSVSPSADTASSSLELELELKAEAKAWATVLEELAKQYTS